MQRSWGDLGHQVVAGMALDAGNTISPSGKVYLQDQMPIVRVNAVAANPQELDRPRHQLPPAAE